MSRSIEKFEDLLIWQNSVDLAVQLYKKLQNCRDFGLRDQIQHSAVSIPSNISEGFDRNSNKEFLRFLRIAKGSCAELRTQLIIAEKINLFDVGNLTEETLKISAMIQKMISYRETLIIK